MRQCEEYVLHWPHHVMSHEWDNKRSFNFLTSPCHESWDSLRSFYFPDPTMSWVCHEWELVRSFYFPNLTISWVMRPCKEFLPSWPNQFMSHGTVQGVFTSLTPPCHAHAQKLWPRLPVNFTDPSSPNWPRPSPILVTSVILASFCYAWVQCAATYTAVICWTLQLCCRKPWRV